MTIEQMIARQQELLNAARSAGRNMTREEAAEFDSLQRSIDAARAAGAGIAHGGQSSTPAAPANNTPEGQRQQTPAAGEGGNGGQDPQNAQRAIEAERQRIRSIEDLCTEFGLEARSYIDNGSTEEQVRAAVLEHLRSQHSPVATGIQVIDTQEDKRKRKEVQKVLEDIDGHALELQRMLDEETFIPAKYTMRRINDGIQKKTRDIAIPRFWPDQCVHHAFVRIFKQIVLHSAYPFSCGCVPGKGMHGAKTAIEKWIRKDPKHTKYVLKLDVRKCYPTMNHEELRKKLQRRIKDKKFLRLADRIIASFQQPMATHERLLPETDAVGIPVGLFTSPWFCNFFFQDIDHKVAEKTGTAHNVRYVDDMVLFDSSKRRLHKALEFIEAEVKATKQTVKDNWQVFILSKRPLDFLGFKFHPNKTTIRKSIMLRISRKARTIARAAYASIRNAHAMVSYIGYIVNSDSQRFYEKWVRPFVNIKHLKGVIADEDRKQHQACVAV